MTSTPQGKDEVVSFDGSFTDGVDISQGRHGIEMVLDTYPWQGAAGCLLAWGGGFELQGGRTNQRLCPPLCSITLTLTTDYSQSPP